MKFINKTALLAILDCHFDAIAQSSKRTSHTPLIIHGINAHDGSPIRWALRNGRSPVISSLSRQSMLLRALRLHAQVSGNKVYKDAADAAIQYTLQNYQNPDGLIAWGGHIFIDAESGEVSGPDDKGLEHELKDTFPYYEAMHEVDSERTLLFLRSFWAHHLADPASLTISRHGDSHNVDFSFARNLKDSLENTPDQSRHLTFVNTANDLVYAGLKYYKYSKDDAARELCGRLLARYFATRNSTTGLGAYMYTVPEQRETAPSDIHTMSWFGDRAARQLGPELGGQALEKNVLLESHAHSLYGEQPMMLFGMYRELGNSIAPLIKEIVKNLEAFCRYIVLPDIGACRPVLSDGTDLTAFELQRDGYFGRRGEKLSVYPINGKMVSSIFMGALLFDSDCLHQTARKIFRHAGLGELGASPLVKPNLNFGTTCSDPLIAICFSDAYRITGHDEYLIAAECIIDRMVRRNWYRPFFKNGAANIYAVFDGVEPYAIAYFLAAHDGIAAEPFHSNNPSIYGGYFRDNRSISLFDHHHYRGVQARFDGIERSNSRQGLAPAN